MKVLFVASNPASEGAINLEAEISALQIVFGKASGEPILFVARPRMLVDDLSEAVLEYKPDVLHITAHGDKEKLAMQNAAGDRRMLTAGSLINLLGSHRPKLIYLNACNSHEIAKCLSASVNAAIGSSAPISNRAARIGAKNFYRQVVSGASLSTAFDAARSSVEVEEGDPSLVCCLQSGVVAERMVLHRIPQLMAKPKNWKSGLGAANFDIRLGLSGCPANTIHLVFFTDDTGWVNYSKNWENDLSTVTRNNPMRGVIWADEDDDIWSVTEDIRMFVAGTTADGQCFIIGSTVADAIENYAEIRDIDRRGPLKELAKTLRDRRD